MRLSSEVVYKEENDEDGLDGDVNAMLPPKRTLTRQVGAGTPGVTPVGSEMQVFEEVNNGVERSKQSQAMLIEEPVVALVDYEYERNQSTYWM